MRRFHFYITLKVALAVACISGSAPAFAQTTQNKTTDNQTTSSTQEIGNTARLNRLYESLKRQRDSAKAANIAGQIRRELADSGSATVNLLMTTAREAAEKKQNATALDLLDRITLLQPEFAEAWQRRAAMHMSMNDNRKAMSDLNRTLTLNPRNFDALAMLAAILAASERDQLALNALEQYLDVYPADKDAQKRMQEIATRLDGSRS